MRELIEAELATVAGGGLIDYTPGMPGEIPPTIHDPDDIKKWIMDPNHWEPGTGPNQ
jgi:hypothetical protein